MSPENGEREIPMNDTFITNIHINKVRHLQDFAVPLSETERKHLIITGKNGSGKTSVVEALRDSISKAINEAGEPTYIITERSPVPQKSVTIDFNGHKPPALFHYFPAHHTLRVDEFKSIEKFELEGSKDLLKYLFDLDYQRLGAESEHNTVVSNRITQWFDNFNRILQEIYECSELVLKLDRKEKEAQIIIPDREPFTLNQMSDGYSSLMDIIVELMIIMDREFNSDYTMSGIIIVDEIETHLHVKLQKDVLRFLTTMFPNIQFIVTTHSAFVINSLENAVVCNLERRIVTQDLSAYSYDGIIEYYYDVNKYSKKVKVDFESYKSLVSKQERTPEENLQLVGLISCLNNIPSAAVPELICAFRDMERKRKEQNGKN